MRDMLQDIDDQMSDVRVGRLLAVDVGAGTQDILLYEAQKPIENCIQMVLPSATQVIARKIRRITSLRKRLFLSGRIMGGGACTEAIKAHLKEGLAVYATPSAAKTIHNDLERVRRLGVEIVEGPSPEFDGTGDGDIVEVKMGDLDIPSLNGILDAFEAEFPRTMAVAVQDHGECPGESNRRFRFKQWENFVLSGGNLTGLLYRKPPPFLTRMNAARETFLDFFGDGKGLVGRKPEIFLMDTGSSALWGALCDEEVRRHVEAGVTVVNVGNGHTLGALVMEERVWGIFEHHTVLVNPEKLRSCVEKLREGSLENEEVFQDGGHGAYVHPHRPRGRFGFVAVTGPNRWIARELGYYMAAPYGNMMLAGCFGLVAAVQRYLGSAPDYHGKA